MLDPSTIDLPMELQHASAITEQEPSVNQIRTDDGDHFGGHEAPSASIPAEEGERRGRGAATLNTLSLSIIMFYSTSGGPFGVEECVKAGGAFYTLLFFLVTPFIWSWQESQIVAELSVAFPHASGSVMWCEEAFGPYAGWLNGLLSWMSGAADNAIYPVLFLDYLLKVLPAEAQEQEDLHPFYRFLLLAFLAVLLGYMNWRGLQLVGNVSMLICCIAMSPFLVMALLSIPKIEPSRWFEKPNLTPEEYNQVSDYSLEGGFFPNLVVGGVLLRPFLNNLFWNFNGYDSVGAFSEEVGGSPERVIPRALSITLITTVLSYFVPLLVAIGATSGTQKDWSDGYMATVATEAVGKWLGGWVVFAAFLSNLGLYQAELSGDVFTLYGMANKGLLPSFLGARSRHGTPTNAIIFATLVVIIFSTAHLDSLIELLNFNYAISLLMEYAAFIKLRISRPDAPRPYRVPLSTTACIIALVPTIFATVLVMLVASYTTLLVGLMSFLVTTALYFIFEKKIREHPSTAEAHQLTEDLELA